MIERNGNNRGRKKEEEKEIRKRNEREIVKNKDVGKVKKKNGGAETKGKERKREEVERGRETRGGKPGEV